MGIQMKRKELAKDIYDDFKLKKKTLSSLGIYKKISLVSLTFIHIVYFF